MKRLRHRIAHWFGWNLGTAETWFRRDGTAMIGFRCKGCGKLLGIHPIRWDRHNVFRELE
jgi:hypothetical protein